MSQPDTISQLPVDDLHESPFNPRKIFDDTALAELAADMQAHGKVLQPLLVRPRIGPLFAGDAEAACGHEIVFGHRRYRAAMLAGLATVPCMVRAMTDDEARRAQISENLQRKDVHPIEEAEGFQALIDNDNETADRIAVTFGKSRSYVYGRLKLLEACPEIRKACLAGEIGSEAALLVARLRTTKLQEKALAYIKADYRAKLDDGGKQSHRAIQLLLAEKFTLDLKGAMFDTEDEMLVPVAGNCVRCVKRTENAPEYADLAEAAPSRFSRSPAGANVCTDPDCFDAKKKAHLVREAGKLVDAGKVLVTGNAARSAISAHGEVKGSYIALKDVKADLAKARQNAQKDSKIVPPQIVLIQDPRTGKTHQAVKREEIKAAGVKVAEPKPAANDWEARERQAKAERAVREAKAKAEQQVRVAVLERITTAMATRPRDAFDLQLVAHAAWAGVEYQARRLLAAIRGKSEHQLEQSIEQLDVEGLTVFIMQCALADSTCAHTYNFEEKPKALLQAAKHYGVDVDQVRAEALRPAGGEAAPTPSPAAHAQKTAKAAPAAADRAGKAKGKGKGKAQETEAAALRAEGQENGAGVAGGDAATGELFEGPPA